MKVVVKDSNDNTINIEETNIEDSLFIDIVKRIDNEFRQDETIIKVC